MPDPDWKTCPLCAERVSAQSEKCVHCGSNMNRAAVEPDKTFGANLVPMRGAVGPAAIFVVVGACLGFAVGTAFDGWAHSLSALIGSGLGLVAYLLLDGPLAEFRGQAPEDEATPTADSDSPEPEPVSEA